MVAAFDYCLHGKGGAAPSIDTAMHGLVDAAHVDHLHPDSGIAIATAADGEALTKEIYGDKVVWVPWRRPGFQLGLDIAAIKAANPQAVGCILGGHGITAWGDTSRGVRAQLAVDHRHRRGLHRRAQQGRAVRARRSRGTPRCRTAERRAARRRAGADDPRRSPRADRPMVGHFTDSDVVLDFLASRRAPAAGRARHVLPRPLPAHQGQAAACSTCPPTASVEESIARLRELHDGVPRGLPGLLRPQRAPPALAGDPRRGPARSCWCPASGCSASARTSRPPASPASSTSTRST